MKLIGSDYVGWNRDTYPNRPYDVVGTRKAPWLFRGTGLRNGARFGVYGAVALVVVLAAALVGLHMWRRRALGQET